ncbi:MAG: hypothetical protein WDA00_05225 [Eubacteriales bacterium]
MVVRYRKTSRAQIRAHGNELIEMLRADSAFEETEARAQEMGLQLALSLKDTYTDIKKEVYVRPRDEQDLPYGYALELCVDLVRDGFIQKTRDAAGQPLQLSLSGTAVSTPDTLLVRQLEFFSYEQLRARNPLPAMLEELLDMAEENGTTPSVFADRPAEPARLLTLQTDPSVFEDVPAVELLPGTFTGKFGGDSSVFLAQDAFFPYLLLLEADQPGLYTPHGVATLDRAAWEALSEQLGELLRALPRAGTFSVLLLSLGIFSFLLPDHAEKLLNQVTLDRPDDFAGTTDALLAWGNEVFAEADCLTLLFP